MWSVLLGCGYLNAGDRTVLCCCGQDSSGLLARRNSLSSWHLSSLPDVFSSVGQQTFVADELCFLSSVMRRNPFGVDICCRKGSRSPLQELYNPIQVGPWSSLLSACSGELKCPPLPNALPSVIAFMFSTLNPKHSQTQNPSSSRVVPQMESPVSDIIRWLPVKTQVR